MKQIYLVLAVILILITGAINAQEYPKGIFNIVWGDTKAKVDKIMHTKKDVYFYKYQEQDKLVYDNVEVSGRKCFLEYIFYKNQLCEIEMLFSISKDELAIAYGQALRELLVKYGSSTRNVRDNSIGLAQAIWEIKASNGKKYSIVLSVNYSTGGFNIFYTYRDLYEQKANDVEKFDAKDF